MSKNILLSMSDSSDVSNFTPPEGSVVAWLSSDCAWYGKKPDGSVVAISGDLSAYANAIDFTMDSDTYVISAVLKHGDTALGTAKTIDLPLETMVISASYDDTDKEIDLKLKNGTVVSFGVSDLVDGLVPDSRTVNSKALANDITLYGSDVLVSAGGDTISQELSNIKTSVAGITTNISNLGGGDMMKADYVNGTSAVARAVGDADGNAIKTTYQKIINASNKISGLYISGSVSLASSAITVNGYTVSANVPSDAKFTDTVVKYNANSVTNILAGSNMSLSYSSGSLTVNAAVPSIDNELTSGGNNAVKGSAIYAAIASKVSSSSLSSVAFTGSYNDLSDKPSATAVGGSINVVTELPQITQSLEGNVYLYVGDTESDVQLGDFFMVESGAMILLNRNSVALTSDMSVIKVDLN